MNNHIGLVVNDLPLQVILNFDLDEVKGQAIVFSPDNGCEFILIRSTTSVGSEIIFQAAYKIVDAVIINNFHYYIVKNY